MFSSEIQLRFSEIYVSMLEEIPKILNTILKDYYWPGAYEPRVQDSSAQDSSAPGPKPGFVSGAGSFASFSNSIFHNNPGY